MNMHQEARIQTRLAVAITLYIERKPEVALLHGSISRALRNRGFISGNVAPAVTDAGREWRKKYNGVVAPIDEVLRKKKEPAPMNHPLKAASFEKVMAGKPDHKPAEKPLVSIHNFNLIRDMVLNPGEWVFLRAVDSASMSWGAFGCLAQVRAFRTLNRRMPTLDELVELSDQPHHVVAGWIAEIVKEHPDFTIPIAA
jgi:hypothetical protein